jgi:hypothetical protein
MPRHATHFASICILSLVYISLHVSLQLWSLIYISLPVFLLYCFWLGCMRFPDQSTPRIGALALTTQLYLDHVPDCIAWRWQMFQSNFLFDAIPQAAWGGFCDTLFLWVVIFGHVRKYL